MDVCTFSGYLCAVSRSEEIKWDESLWCLWIIHLEAEVRQVGGRLQVSTCTTAHLRKPHQREVNVPNSATLDLLCEGLSSQKQHSQQLVVGGGKPALSWQAGRVSHPFDVEWFFQIQQRWASVSFPWLVLQELWSEGNWVTGQEGLQSQWRGNSYSKIYSLQRWIWLSLIRVPLAWHPHLSLRLFPSFPQDTLAQLTF